MDLDPTLSYVLTVVRESVNEDNDPVGAVEFELADVRLAQRNPQPDSAVTGERVVTQYDARHPDRAVDLRGTDRIRMPWEPATERARWTIEGDPARSPWSDGGCLFVLQRERG
jgi:hypothetical protein